MDIATAKTYYYNFIHSHLTYGIHIYFNMSPAKRTNKLFLLQKKAIRLIKEVKISDKLSTTKLCTDLNILPLPKLADYFTTLFAHRTLTKRAPDYILARFPTPRQSHTHRNLNTLPSSFTYNQLDHKIVTLFNSLPPVIRSLKSSVTFKTQIRSYLLQNL